MTAALTALHAPGSQQQQLTDVSSKQQAAPAAPASPAFTLQAATTKKRPCSKMDASKHNDQLLAYLMSVMSTLLTETPLAGTTWLSSLLVPP
jgi:hypothetical protein